MIPFLDLKAQYAGIRDELNPAVLQVLGSAEYVLGSRVKSFEDNFASYCGARHAVALNTGTSALHLALLALGVKPGDEIITVSMTFVATVAAIRYANATPVLIDIDPATWNMNPELIEKAITPRTKAIVPVHLHGRMADMPAIMAIARRHGIPVIEDAAQAHGAEIDGQGAGTFGDIGCFSFYPGKNLGACGEGGAIITNRDDLAAEVRLLRDWGQAEKYNHVKHGFNYRMDGLQGAILDVKLRHLDDWTSGRRAVAAVYDDRLGKSGISIPARPKGREHVYHVYAIRTTDRPGVQEELKQLGISTGIHYPRPVHLQPAYQDIGLGVGDLPITEKFAAETLSLPIYAELSDEQVERVCDAVAKVCSGTAFAAG